MIVARIFAIKTLELEIAQKELLKLKKKIHQNFHKFSDAFIEVISVEL